MTQLLELKQFIKNFYMKQEVWLIPAGKFVLALISLILLRTQLGYQHALNHVLILIMASLLCAVMPANFIPALCAIFIIGHIYVVSSELALISALLFLVMFLLYFHFSPRDTLVVVLTPICFLLKIPYVIPLILGLAATPLSIVSMAFGILVTYLIQFVQDNAASFSSAGVSEETTNRVWTILGGVLGSKSMLVVLFSFAITLVLVYFIRRSKADHCWSIAIVAGALTGLLCLLVGELLYGTNINFLAAIIGTIVSALMARVFQFMRFNLDYLRTENVQFEDDEYYYYVKAVPKVSVPLSQRRVKRINRVQGGRMREQHYRETERDRSIHGAD